MSVFVDVRKEVQSGCYVKNSREVFDFKFKSLSEAVRLFLYYSLDAGGSG